MHILRFDVITCTILGTLLCLASEGTVLPADDPHGCKKLLSENNLDCAACIQNIPPETSCSGWTATDDADTERAALFKGKGGTKIWNSTDSLFATDAVQDVELKMSVNDWNFLKGDPGKEQWITGSVVIASETVAQVGLRFKGFYGSLRICLHGVMNCEKLSWKMKFDHVDQNQRFRGLKRLQLHASIHDVTLMRERLTYSLWREMGVPAPRQSYAKVKLTLGDGTSYNLGVHILTEQIDGRFTEAFKSSGDKGDGNLYKEAWPGTGSVSATSFKAALRTNTKTNNGNPDVSRLVDFGTAVAQATNDYDLAMVMKEYTRAKEWAKYWAVDRAVENWDGPINFRVTADDNCEEFGYPVQGQWNKDGDCCTVKGKARCKNGATPIWKTTMCVPSFQAYYYTCGAQQSWNHNYYLYQEDETNASKQEFRMIGWDVDSTWLEESALKHHVQARGESKPREWDTPVGTCTNCVTCSAYNTGSSAQIPPGCFSTIRAFARGLRSDYKDAANELLSGPLQTCRLQSKIDRWKAALAPHIQQDVSDGVYPATGDCWNSGKSVDWNAEVTKFRNTIVPWYVQRFKNSIACSRNYNANDWSAVNDHAISPMLRLNEWQTQSWMPNWLGGGQCLTSGVHRGIGCQLSALVVLSLLSWM